MASRLSIFLLGNSGVGKSASGNTILGRAAFESRRSFKSVTTKISEETETVCGRQISVIDTPGILGSEELIESQCQQLLQNETCCLFLLVVKIDRFTEEQQKAANAAIRAVGSQGLKRTYLLFTGGDSLDMTLEEFINEDNEGPLPALVARFEDRYLMFNNKHGGLEQVRHLLQKSDSVPSLSSSNEVRRILLFGLSGAGKSSSGNTILGSDEFISATSFNSVTTGCVSKSANVDGRQVTVMDTPGFTDDGLSPEQLASDILKAILNASAGFHALVIVVKISRVSNKDFFLLQQFPNLFGRHASKYTMVLFTNGDMLRGQSLEGKITENNRVSDLVSMCAGRYSVFDNTARGNRQQVREFLGKVDQIVVANGEGHCSFDNMVVNLIESQRTQSEPAEDNHGVFQRIYEWLVWLIRCVKDILFNFTENRAQPFIQMTLSQ